MRDFLFTIPPSVGKVIGDRKLWLLKLATYYTGPISAASLFASDAMNSPDRQGGLGFRIYFL